MSVSVIRMYTEFLFRSATVNRRHVLWVGLIWQEDGPTPPTRVLARKKSSCMYVQEVGMKTTEAFWTILYALELYHVNMLHHGIVFHLY